MSENGPNYQPRTRRRTSQEQDEGKSQTTTTRRRSVASERPQNPTPTAASTRVRSARPSAASSRRSRSTMDTMYDEASFVADTEPMARPRPNAAPKKPAPPKPQIKFSGVKPPRTSSRVNRGLTYGLRVNITLGRVLSFICLLAVLGVTYWLLNSPNFLVTQVTVTGGNFLTTDAVITQTGVDKTNVFLLDEQVVANRIKQLPYVLDAQVQKSLPNKLSVQVMERTEAVDWRVGNVNYLVDKDGVVLQVVTSLPPNATDFPVVSSQDATALKIGDKVDMVAVQSAEPIFNAFSQNKLALSALNYSPFNGLTAVSKDGNWKVLLGSSDEIQKKISILQGLLADKDLKWSFADLRSTSRPAVQ